MIVKPIKTRIFLARENLVDFIIEHIDKLEEDSVLVITSKIVALSEGRVVEITSDEEKERIIMEESDYAYHHPYGWLSIVDGLMSGSAGLDSSNVEGDLYSLLPNDSFQSAKNIRDRLKQHYNLEKLGVIVTDSRLMPLRKGALGAAFGYAGIKALRKYVGTPDIYGRLYERQKANIPDALATASVLVMGEGKERHPLALITSAPVEFTDKEADKMELQVPAEDDIYYYFYRSLPDKN